MSKKVKARLGFPENWQETTLQIPDNEPAPWSPDHKFQWVNKEVPRLDGWAKVTGTAKYATDIRLQGLLYARVLHSPHPCARIKSIDTKKAEALPGVKAVVVLPAREIRFVGQEIAAVAATSTQIAEDAARLIKVDYEIKPFVVDLDAARKKEAPLVYAKRKSNAPKGLSGNVRPGRLANYTKGDPDKGFREADKVIEATFRTQVQTHSCLEPHTFTAAWKGDQLTVWASTQSTFSVRDELAQVFNIPTSQVRVLTEYMGGGFGSKFGARAEGKLAAMLAKKAKAPVSLALTRKAEHLAAGNRPNSVQTLKIGVRKDGAISALQLQGYGSGGISGGAGTARPAMMLYPIPNLKIQEADVFTHAGPARAFRAPGHPQGVFALEQTVDMCAEAVGMDPMAFRLKNDTHPVRRKQIAIGARRIGWDRRNKQPGAGKGPKKRGLGMASGHWYNTGRAGAEIQVKIHKDGAVQVLSGGQDIGTGIRTLLGQIVAEELTLPLKQISVTIGDTNLPYAPGSGGSKTTPCVTPAARKAAYQAKEKLFDLTRKVLKLSKDDKITLQKGVFSSTKDPKKSIAFRKLTTYLPNGTLSVQAEREANYKAFNEIIAGVQFADVEVDIETGIIRVLKVVAVHDCGLVMNKLTARSQVNGGVIQGLSYALFEDRHLDPRNGHMVNPNLEAYKIAGAVDMPEIDSVLFDVYAGSNNTHALGLGEPTTIPTSAAIANAVYNAIGARVQELPMTPARVLAALAAKHGKKGGAQ